MKKLLAIAALAVSFGAFAQNTANLEVDGTVTAECNLSSVYRGTMGSDMQGNTMMISDETRIAWQTNVGGFYMTFGNPYLLGPSGNVPIDYTNLSYTLFQPSGTVSGNPNSSTTVSLQRGSGGVLVNGYVTRTDDSYFEVGDYTLIIPLSCAQ